MVCVNLQTCSVKELTKLRHIHREEAHSLIKRREKKGQLGLCDLEKRTDVPLSVWSDWLVEGKISLELQRHCRDDEKVSSQTKIEYWHGVVKELKEDLKRLKGEVENNEVWHEKNRLIAVRDCDRKWEDYITEHCIYKTDHHDQIQKKDEEWDQRYRKLEKDYTAYRVFFQNVVRFNDQVTSALENELRSSEIKDCAHHLSITQATAEQYRETLHAADSKLADVNEDEIITAKQNTASYIVATDSTSENVFAMEFLRLSKLFDEMNCQDHSPDHNAQVTTVINDPHTPFTDSLDQLDKDGKRIKSHRKLVAYGKCEPKPLIYTTTDNTTARPSDANKQLSSQSVKSQDQDRFTLGNETFEELSINGLSNCPENAFCKKQKRKRIRKRNDKNPSFLGTGDGHRVVSGHYPEHAPHQHRTRLKYDSRHKANATYKQDYRCFPESKPEASSSFQPTLHSTVPLGVPRNVLPIHGVSSQPMISQAMQPPPVSIVPPVNVLNSSYLPSLHLGGNGRAYETFGKLVQPSGYQPCVPTINNRRTPVYGIMNRNQAISANRRPIVIAPPFQRPHLQFVPRLIPVYLV